MDRQFQEMARFVKHCLWYNKGKDPTIKILQEKYEKQIESLGDITEKKRCYVSTYGLDSWDDNLINFEREVKEENSLENLFNYWKKKEKKRSINKIDNYKFNEINNFYFSWSFNKRCK